MDAYADAVAVALDDPWHGFISYIETACARPFDPSGLVLIHMANAGVVNATGDAAPDARRRVVALITWGPPPLRPGRARCVPP